MIGRTVSHYRILSELGSGGMGVVYRAEDLTLGRHVALKFLPPHLSSDPDARCRFVHEAKAAASLDHSGICTVYDSGEVDGQLFIAMALLEGQTLKDRIAEGPLPLAQAIELAAQIAEALHEAHGKGVTHRDIKPANIMLTPKGQAKVMDFGLAHVAGASQMTRSGSTLGTAAYMSPEQARGETVDRRADIWSLGVVLHETVAGRKPFASEHEAGLAYAIQHVDPEPLTGLRTGVPLDLEKVVGKCLAKDAGQRYQHADDLAVDLRRLLMQVDATRTVIEPFSPSPKPPKARRWIPVAAAVVVVVAGALFLLCPGREAPVTVKSVRQRTEIAVLPFQNLSGEASNAYFSGGLQDELLTQLSKVAALKVISRTSAMSYQGTTKPLRQIAEELGVGSVVEGSIQVIGGRLRVNVQLIDAASDNHIWAERYDRTLDDAFAIQSEVAQRIVTAVGAALTGDEQGKLAAAPTANAEAYRLYLQGREHWSRPRVLRQDTEVVQQFYERALGLDPNFALAHAALSQVHGRMFLFKYDPSPARAARQREEAEIALRLAPDLPEAHIAMGLAHYWGRRDYRRALDEFAIALRGMPNDADLYASIGWVHRRLGNWNEVFDAFDKATLLDPHSAGQFRELGNTYTIVHRYPEAIRAYDRARSLAPDLNGVAVARGWAYVRWQGQLDTLRAIMSRAPHDAAPEKNDAILLLWERDADGLLRELPRADGDVFETPNSFLPVSLYAAWAHQLRGDRASARTAFGSALALADSALKIRPDDERLHEARGLALAGLGRAVEAQQEARWLQQSVVYGEDAYEGPILATNRARILAQAGDAEAALDEIERLLAGPSYVTVHTLRLDPLFDPIREHPRFKALLVKYGPKEAR
jgi:serine/threonine protein kinase/tetratricopeptide (TPR) repeat protein